MELGCTVRLDIDVDAAPGWAQAGEENQGIASQRDAAAARPWPRSPQAAERGKRRLRKAGAAAGGRRAAVRGRAGPGAPPRRVGGCQAAAWRSAAAMPAFRQVGEKQLPQEVVFMAWSPKRDLIALANRAGEVSAAGTGAEGLREAGAGGGRHLAAALRRV